MPESQGRDRSLAKMLFDTIVIAVSGLMLCLAAVAAEQFESVEVNRTMERLISPGQQHAFRIVLKPGRNHIYLEELGIDLALSVEVGNAIHQADTPTARFSIEQVWLDVDEPTDAVIRIKTYRDTGVPMGRYMLTVNSAYQTSTELRLAETLTSQANNVFAQSDVAGLSAEKRTAFRREAIGFYLRAARVWGSLGDFENTAYSWHAAAYIAGVQLSDEPAARSYLENAATNWERAGQTERVVAARKDIGQSLYREQRWESATQILDTVDDALAHDDVRMVFLAAVAKNDLCLIAMEQGRLERALTECEAAAEAFGRIGDDYEYNNTLHNVAMVHRFLGDYAKAIGLLRGVLERQSAIGNKLGQAKALGVMTDYLRESGELDEAMRAYDESYAIFAEHGLLTWQASLLVKYSRLEALLDRPERVREHLDRALQLAVSANDARWQGRARLYLAQLEQRLGNVEEAIAQLSTALDVFQRSEDTVAIADTYTALIDTLIAADDLAAAQSMLDEFRIHQESHDLSAVYTNLLEAKILTRQDKFGAALPLVKEAIVEFMDLGSVLGQLEAGELLADLLERQGRWDDLLAHLEAQRVLIRTVGHSLILPEQKSRFFAQYRHYYERLIAGHRKAGNFESGQAILEMLNAAEEIRATALITALESDVNGVLSRAPSDLQLQYHRSKQKVSQLISGASGRYSGMQSQWQDALHSLERIQNRIWDAESTLSELDNRVRIERSDIQALIDTDTAILYYFFGEKERFGLWLGTDGFERFDLRADVPISELSAQLLHEYHTPNSQQGLRVEAANALSAALLSPVRTRLDSVRRLIVVPDGPLHSVPFSGLPWPGTGVPVIQKVEVAYVPSLRAAMSLAPSMQRGSFSVAAIGDPVTDAADPRLKTHPQRSGQRLARVPGTGREMRALERIIGMPSVTLFDGFDAVKTLVEGNKLKGYSILHFATHGIADQQSAERSGLYLSTFDRDGHAIDGHLGLRDLFGLRFDAQLVVLSGCSTSLGEWQSTDGPVGISRAFQYSGVSNVVSTLWKVDDRASAELITDFYAALAGGEAVPAALRSAQTAMLERGEHRHPYYWAGFQSTGHWGVRWEKTAIANTGD